jgi:hypothetical protein
MGWTKRALAKELDSARVQQKIRRRRQARQRSRKSGILRSQRPAGEGAAALKA